MRVRPRRDADIPELVELAEAVLIADRWPPHRVGSTRDFIVGSAPLAALVAEDEGKVVGQVLLHKNSAPQVMTIAADALRVDPQTFAVVARLFVDPRARRRGLGQLLFQAAESAARELDKHPILDVWTELESAIALYEGAGWRRLGEATFTFSSECGPECLHAGNSLRSFVYSAPTLEAP